MRLCRFEQDGTVEFGFYDSGRILPFLRVADEAGVDIPEISSLIDFLPAGKYQEVTHSLHLQLEGMMDEEQFPLSIDVEDVKLLVPFPSPGKLMLLAGNYPKHVEETGWKAEEREKTFPYVFMKPPLTTLTNPNDPIKIPGISPDYIDWELELAVIIGKECNNVCEEDALDYVAGYSIINDISNRKFKPNPSRNKRGKDVFFDWLHGKWHDTFCPMGPCVLAANENIDPQSFKLTLSVNGHVEQDSSTTEMIFPVAAIIEFISSFTTLMPGDIISTGTPSGVGLAKGKYLKPGDLIDAEIAEIGVLHNPVE
ncbi:Fumarylacetoacetate hydrolase family protein [hydrothermal vent metagenome]|uniref:Fumarylacetoacetate hydrolase family protein n=1 Tax=hydrothermal vent metagenome TaxID=652676 RepID=A0A3B1DRA1_9ZZZZ